MNLATVVESAVEFDHGGRIELQDTLLGYRVTVATLGVKKTLRHRLRKDALATYRAEVLAMIAASTERKGLDF